MKDEEQISVTEKHDTDPRIDLAIERTRLALERTQLAWIRTIITMITAGIAIDRGFAALHDARLVTGDAWVKNGHLAGLVLSVSGTLLIILTTIFYSKRTGELYRMEKRKSRVFDSGTILSLLVTIIGLLVIYFVLIAG